MDYTKIKPLRDDVLLRLKPARETASSVIFYEEQIEHSALQNFYVVAVGEDVKHLSVGDIVVCSWKRITPPFEAYADGKLCKFGITSEKEIDCIVEV